MQQNSTDAVRHSRSAFFVIENWENMLYIHCIYYCMYFFALRMFYFCFIDSGTWADALCNWWSMLSYTMWEYSVLCAPVEAGKSDLLYREVQLVNVTILLRVTFVSQKHGWLIGQNVLNHKNHRYLMCSQNVESHIQSLEIMMKGLAQTYKVRSGTICVHRLTGGCKSTRGDITASKQTHMHATTRVHANVHLIPIAGWIVGGEARWIHTK